MAKLLAVRMRDVIDEDELTSCGGEAVARCLPQYDSTMTPFRPYIDQRLRWAMLHEARRRRRQRVDPRCGSPTMVATRYRDKVATRVRHTALEGDRSNGSLLNTSATPTSVGRWCLFADLDDAAMAPDETAEEQVLRSRQAIRVRAVVNGLKPRLRTIVSRHYFEGDSFADIARQLGVTRSAVCRTHKLALHALSKRLLQEV